MKAMCTYTHMTRYVEDKWNELKTYATKIVSDKSTETTAKLKADYNAKFRRFALLQHDLGSVSKFFF